MLTINRTQFLIQLVQSLGVKKLSSTLQELYRKMYYYKQKLTNPSFHPLKNGGKRTGFTTFQIKAVHYAVIFFITRKPTTILKEIQQFVIKVLGITRSTSWYCRFLASIDVTWKSVELKEINKYTPLNISRFVNNNHLWLVWSSF